VKGGIPPIIFVQRSAVSPGLKRIISHSHRKYEKFNKTLAEKVSVQLNPFTSVIVK